MNYELPLGHMSNEIPKNEPEIEETGAKEVEKELSEDEKQTNFENACRERFVQDWIITSTLTPEQKVSVTEYINSKPGAWREYNGQDFKVVEAKVEGNVWKVSFGVYFDDYEAQRIDVEIPL